MRLLISRSTLLIVTAEIQVEPLKQTFPNAKGGCLQRQVLQAVPSPAALWGVPGQLQDGALLPRVLGGPGSTRPGETQVLKGHFCLCNQRGVGGPCGVSNLLNVVCDTRHRAEKNMQQSQQLGEQINSHAKSQQVSFHGWSTLKRHPIFLRLILGDVSG